MEALTSQWKSKLENDEAMLNHEFEIGSSDMFAAAYGQNLQYVVPSEPNESCFPFESSLEEPLMNQATARKDNTWKMSAGTSNNVSFPCVISFGGQEEQLHGDHETLALKRQKMVGQEASKHSCNEEHVVAERKRRERLNQLFTKLSGTIPGLKKTAKTALLEEAVNYVKQLEAKLRILQDETANMGSISNSHSCIEEPLLTINGRASEKTISLRIHCKTCKKVLVKFLSEIENQHLTITSTNLTTFSESYLDITLIAQAEEGFSMTINELVEKLYSSFRLLI